MLLLPCISATVTRKSCIDALIVFSPIEAPTSRLDYTCRASSQSSHRLSSRLKWLGSQASFASRRKAPGSSVRKSLCRRKLQYDVGVKIKAETTSNDCQVAMCALSAISSGGSSLIFQGPAMARSAREQDW
jgi:hypothetical protein